MVRSRLFYRQRYVVSPRKGDLPFAEPERSRAYQDVDGLLFAEVIVVGPSPASGRHLVEAATQFLPAGSRAQLLTTVAKPLPVRLLAPFQIFSFARFGCSLIHSPFQGQTGTGNAPSPIKMIMSTAKELNVAWATRHGSRLFVLR